MYLYEKMGVLCAAGDHFDSSFEYSGQQINCHCKTRVTKEAVTRIHLDIFRVKLMPKTSSLVCKKLTCGFCKEVGYDRRNFPKHLQEDPSNPENSGASSNR